MKVVVEAVAELLHLAVQFLFAGVRERRMADIVNQRQRFRQVFIQPQRVRDRSRDLRHLDGMGQPVAEMVGKPAANT